MRESKGLSGQALADAMGRSRNTISNWMNGNTRPSSTEFIHLIHTIRKIAGCSDEEERFLREAYVGFRIVPPLHNAPFDRNDYFTGREELLEQLHDQLAPQSHLKRIAAITGLPGIGKTHVALEYAHRYMREHSPIFWVTADSRETVITDFCKLAQDLQLPEKDAREQERVVAAVQRWLREHPNWLLVLDNVEDLSMVGKFIPSGCPGALLLTTRLQPTKPIAQDFVLKTMTDDESAWFLLRRTDRLSLDAPLTGASPDDDREARAIAEALGGLPLALDQAGAYILETQCALADYLLLYKRERARLLAQRGAVPSDHPESVVITFSLAFERVQQKNPASVDMLRLCAFLAPDRIPEDLFLNGSGLEGTVLEHIGHDLLAFNEAVRGLYRYSLIQRNTDQRTLSVHRLVQAVLQDGMDEQSQTWWAARALVAVAVALPPYVQFETWADWERLLSHALECTRHIDRYTTLISVLAAGLLYRTGQYLTMHARYEEAESLCRRALAIWEQTVGPHHPSIPATLSTLGQLCQLQGKLADAEPLYQRALAIDEHTWGSGHRHTADDLSNLTALYQAQGKYIEAEGLLLKALAIIEQTLGPDHPGIVHILINLAGLYRDHGKLTDAERLYQRAVAICEQTFGPEHPHNAPALVNLAALYQAQGKHDVAERLFQRALALYERTFGPEHSFTKDVLTDYANFLRETGRADEASALELRRDKES